MEKVGFLLFSARHDPLWKSSICLYPMTTGIFARYIARICNIRCKIFVAQYSYQAEDKAWWFLKGATLVIYFFLEIENEITTSYLGYHTSFIHLHHSFPSSQAPVTFYTSPAVAFHHTHLHIWFPYR